MESCMRDYIIRSFPLFPARAENCEAPFMHLAQV
jgi:hypothetical protein